MQHLHKIESTLFMSGQKIEFLPIEFDDGDKQIKRYLFAFNYLVFVAIHLK